MTLLYSPPLYVNKGVLETFCTKLLLVKSTITCRENRESSLLINHTFLSIKIRVRKINYSTLTFYFPNFYHFYKTKQNAGIKNSKEVIEFLHQFLCKTVITKLVSNVNTKHRLISLLVICIQVVCFGVIE